MRTLLLFGPLALAAVLVVLSGPGPDYSPGVVVVCLLAGAWGLIAAGRRPS